MNGRAVRAAVSVVTAALPAQALTAQPADVQSATHGRRDKLAVTQLEHRWIADIGSGNRADLATILAEDYRDTDWQGRVRDKEALLASISKPSGTSQHICNLQVRA